MRFTIVLFGANGRAARSLRTNAGVLLGALTLGLAAFGAVLLIGWKIGELTARL
jgi:hypothetical protein